MEYLVMWEIEVSADSPKEAAQKALDIQRDKTSWATVFNVSDENGESATVDLLADDEEEPEEEDQDLSYLAKQAAKYDHEQNLDKED